MELRGTHVLVTGGSRGIGACLVAEARARGAQVTAVARSADPLAQVTSAHGAAAVVADLGDPDEREALLGRVEAEHGPVDVLACNAGVHATAGLLEVTAAALEELVAVNLLAPLELVRQALPGMLERGRGHVLLMSSGFSTITAPGLAPYAATKAGVSHFAAGLVAELRGTPVGVTVVEPGPVRTRMLAAIDAHPLAGPAVRRLVHLGLTRVVEREEVARRALDGVAAGHRHVVVPRRMTPALALGWVPRALGELAQSGAPRRTG